MQSQKSIYHQSMEYISDNYSECWQHLNASFIQWNPVLYVGLQVDGKIMAHCVVCRCRGGYGCRLIFMCLHTSPVIPFL